MRLRELLISVTAMLSLAAAPVQASGPKGAPGPKSHGNSSATHASTTTHGSAKNTTAPPQKTAHGNTKTTTTSAGTHGSAKKASTTPTEPLNPIAQKISANKGLSPKMATLLPPNMSLNEASKGFKNQGQFIAALHVSQNLGISFADLKTAMTGIRPVTTKPGGTTTVTVGTTTTSSSTTTSQPTLLSLGQAIKKLSNGSVDADAAAAKATKQATADLGDK